MRAEAQTRCKHHTMPDNDNVRKQETFLFPPQSYKLRYICWVLGWRRKDWTKKGWMSGWTSCHDDRVALSVCWLMKSVFACLSNQMAEQRMQHEQERTRLQQQHSAEKDSLVQERQREVNSLERQARAALQQHQQHTQEWRKRDAQVGGLH